MSLGSVINEAQILYLQLREQGLSRDEATVGLERVIRETWPKPRRDDGRLFACLTCHDSGWEWAICEGLVKCGRPFRLPKQRAGDYTGSGQCVPGHSFVRPCFCRKGEAIAAQLQGRANEGDDFTTAGKSRPMTRLGR